MLTYNERNSVILSMGYTTYIDYQDSVLWAKIRLTVLKDAEFVCVLCQGGASQVHHSVYTEDNLTGKSLEGLHAICPKCHRLVEFDGDNKLTSKQALEKFNSLMKSRNPTKKKKRNNPAIGLARRKLWMALRRGKSS